MKLNGQSVLPPPPLQLKFYRGDTEICLHLGPVMDWDEFNTLVPDPVPPLEYGPKVKTPRPLLDDKQYQAKVEAKLKLKTMYLAIKALSYTPGLTWENVQLNDPTTWKNYESELKQSFTDFECGQIINAVYEANGPSKRTQKDAMDLFSASQVDTKPTTSQTGEPNSTQSSEPVKD